MFTGANMLWSIIKKKALKTKARFRQEIRYYTQVTYDLNQSRKS